jgi:hypothetical protein
MGKRIVAIPLDEEYVVFAEINEADAPEGGDPLAPIADAHDVVERAAGSVRSALDSVILPTTHTIFSRIGAAAQPPASVELGFGLKLTGKLGAVFAATEAEGHIQVKLTWNQSHSSAGPPAGPA